VQIELLQILSLSFYIAATLSVYRGHQQTSFAWLACIIHIYGALVELGGSSQFSMNGAYAVYFSTAFVVLGFLMSNLRNNIHILGFFLYPFAALSNVFALVAPLPTGHEISFALKSHILLSIIAFSTIALGALEAILIYILRNRLKNHKTNALDSFMPPLQTLETLLFQTISIGTLILSAAIITSALFVDNFFAIALLPKTLLTFMAWGLFTVLLIGRRFFGWRGQLVIRITLVGYGLLLISFIAAKLLVRQ